MKWFYSLVCPDEKTRILDIGAEIVTSSQCELQFVDSYQWKSNISVINLSQQHIEKIKKTYPMIDACVGNACNLPYPDKAFDVVYSNAVIEHVGSYEDQKKMASEIMRVGKRWYITTPNRWYPFEFHMRLPFVTWLPFHVYREFGRILTYDHVKKKYVFGVGETGLRLLSSSDLKRCFPGSQIIRSRVTFMAETLIVYGGKSS